MKHKQCCCVELINLNLNSLLLKIKFTKMKILKAIIRVLHDCLE